MIYIDATEARDNTRLPYSLVKCSKPLTGLESLTGADILVTPHNDNELVSHRKSKVSRQALRRIQDNWAATGWAFPLGIGQVMRENLAKYVVEVWKRPPTLANAICLACSEEVLKVSGWGEVSMNNVQEWYGVNRTVPPNHIGAESGCWIYSLPLRDEPEKKVLIVGGHIIEGDKVYEVVKEELGTIGEPVDLDGKIVLM